MVLADGVVDSNELLTLYRIGREQYGLSEEVINKIVISCGTSKPDLQTLEEKVSFLYQLSEIACADGQIDDTERALLLKYILYYGFDKEKSDHIADYLLNKALNKVPYQDVLNEIIG